MLSWLRYTASVLFFGFAAACVSYVPIEVDDKTLTSDEIAEDLDAFVDFVTATHPDIEYTADVVEISNAAARVKASLPDTLSVRDAWTAMAVLNPVFGDAHVGVRRPLHALAAYEESGGHLFPASVYIEADGVIRFTAPGIEAAGIRPGDELVSINGIASRDIVETLTPRMRGNSDALGRLIMGRYFPQFFWTVYGGYDRYVVRVKSAAETRSVTLAVDGARVEAGDTPFRFEKLTDKVAYLGVSTFDISEKDRFQVFVTDAFAQIAADDTDTIIIDLRENGGGAHDVSDLLMAYLTDKPYSAISKVTARITPENIQRIPGATLGAVVTLPFQQTINPPENLLNRFTGKVYALIGGLTYSQAIAFSSTLQDYGLATIVGEETEGPANQTGQVQMLTLPNTGFEALAPIYIFTRASGDTSNRGVIPDLELADDPRDPNASVARLLEIIEK